VERWGTAETRRKRTGRDEGGALGADGEAVGGVLDVGTTEHAATGGHDGAANLQRQGEI